MQVRTRVERSRSMEAAPEEVYALLSNIPESVSHFPDVVDLKEENGGYTWRMKPVGVVSIRVQTEYACRYLCDDAGLGVRWEPIEGVGNAVVSGRWTIEAEGEGTRLGLLNEFVTSFDVPLLFRAAAQPFVQRLLEGLIDRYLDNLATTFAGGDGRVGSWS